MPFIHTGIFWVGLAAVSVPIIIHLLNRRRFRVRDWAAMQFLMESVRKNRRRLRIEEIILLALRCLAVFLIAAALARFTGCNAIDRFGAGSGTSETIVFVLDDSCSMGQRQGAQSIFAGACANLADRIESMPPANKVGIVLTSQTDAASPFCPLNYITEKTSLVARLAELKTSDTRSNLGQALTAAEEMLNAQEGLRRVVVLSDFRKADLQDAQTAGITAKAFKNLADAGVTLTMLDFSRQAKGNLTFDAFECLDKVVLAGSPTRLALSVRNNGTTTVDNLSVAIDGVFFMENQFKEVSLPAQSIDSIRPGESRRVEFSVTCPQVGPASIRASISADGDELQGDDRMELALSVRKALRVLVVDGAREVAEPTMSESFFLARAIDPNRDGNYGVHAEVISSDDLNEVKFDDYEMVVLMNVASFTPVTKEAGEMSYPQVDALEQYVRTGGGLAVFLGDKIDPSFYNDRFYNRGNGLSPLPIRSLVEAGKAGTNYEDVSFFRMSPRSIAADRMLDIFRGEAAAFANLIRFETFYRAEEGASMATSQEAQAPRVLARFADDNSSPAIAARQLGQGMSIMFYSSGSAKWNDWPKAEMDTYVVVMLDMLVTCSRPQPTLSGNVSSPISYQLPMELQDAKAQLKTPRYPARDVIPLKPDKGMLRFDLASEAGSYTLELAQPGGTSSFVLFSRNVDAAEGDLRCGGQAGLATALGSDKFEYRQPMVAQVEQTAPARDYWQWVIAALLAVLAVEVFLAQRFGHYS